MFTQEAEKEDQQRGDSSQVEIPSQDPETMTPIDSEVNLQEETTPKRIPHKKLVISFFTFLVIHTVVMLAGLFLFLGLYLKDSSNNSNSNTSTNTTLAFTTQLS